MSRVYPGASAARSTVQQLAFKGHWQAINPIPLRCHLQSVDGLESR